MARFKARSNQMGDSGSGGPRLDRSWLRVRLRLTYARRARGWNFPREQTRSFGRQKVPIVRVRGLGKGSKVIDVPEIDLISGAFYASDPDSAYRWMREHAPVYYDAPNDIYGIALHEDIMAVSKDADTYCSGRGFRPDAPNLPMMINMDRPEHTIRRNLVSRGFTPNRVSVLEPRIRELCAGIVDAAIRKGAFDFVSNVAALIPLSVIAELLGVPPEDHPRLLRWSEDLMHALGSTDPQLIVRQATALAEWNEYSAAMIADRREHPGGDDLISILVHSEIDGERLDDVSILMESLLILIGGDETARHVLSGGMYQLLSHPAQLQQLLDDPTGIPCAVEEMLRWATPFQNMMRTVTRDTELRGTRLPEGARLLLLYPSANRDERVFERPGEFDITRDPNPHVAFGGNGNHFCLGSALARLELRVAFEEILARMPGLKRTTTGTPSRVAAAFATGIESLPVRP